MQRNKGIALALAEILFLLDDDSFISPGCVERIMAVYEADHDGQIGGIQTGTTAHPPPTAFDAGVQEKPGSRSLGTGGEKRQNRLIRWLMRRVLLMDKGALFIPYDGPFDRSHLPLPDVLAGQKVWPAWLFQGYHMTFRRQAVLDEPFDELLRYYCPGEDIDACYRVGCRYRLLTAPDARLHHFNAAGGGLTGGAPRSSRC